MQKFIIDQFYDLPVNRNVDPSEKFFRVIVDDGVEVRLPKFKYQIGKELPETVFCRVKSISNGLPVLSHVPSRHVFDLYGRRNWQHEAYDFRVNRLPAGADSPYELVDDNGILFRLYDREARLVEGQTVRCRFERLTDKVFQIRRAYDEYSLQLMTFDEVLAMAGMAPALRGFVRRQAERLPQFAAAIREYDEKRAGWVVTATQSLRDCMAEFFAQARVPRNTLALRGLLEGLRQASTSLLENSEFLRNTAGDVRSGLQNVLTETAESVKPYLKALDLIDRNCYEEYVTGLIEKLRISGYLYHPKLQFATMLAIFRLRPHLAQTTIGSIFDAVKQWRLDTWVAEPFRSAFIEQFEIFVADARHRLEYLPQVETNDDLSNLENVLTAIALQLHIADQDQFVHYGLNRSRLYRYASLARPRSADDLLDKAFYTLLNGGTERLEFSYDSIKNYTLMVTALSRPMHEAQRSLATKRTLAVGQVRVEVGPDGLVVRRTDSGSDARPVLPNGMMHWLSPQIVLDDVPVPNASAMRKYQGHQDLWRQIELALLEETDEPQTPAYQAKAEPGDEVEIRVVASEPALVPGNPRLLCEVVDPNFEHTYGYLYREDITDYKVKDFNPSGYTDEAAHPLHFWALVKGTDADGKLLFSLKEAADRAVRDEIANRTDEFLAVITANYPGQRYSAISDHGFGLMLDRSEGFDDLPVRTVVRVRLTDIPVSGFITGEIIDYATGAVGGAESLAYLMRQIGYEQIDEEESDDDIIRDADEILSADELLEVVEMLRFKALATPQLLAAVDYLSLAALLARIVGADDLADDLSTHRSLLGQHQYYADNTRIDADSLDRLAPAVEGRPMLERIFTRLRIVSWLGDIDRMPDLQAYIDAPRNELEGTLAKLVGSYNLLASGAIEDTDSLRFIKKRIAELLGVNSETHHLKHYGSESQYVEFKSSLVFPARKKGQTHCDADKERQHREILEIIAGFLNSTGGTLFIGVNDQHYEKGLAEDFPYLPKDVRSMDNLGVYLENIVRNSYDQGKNVGNYVHISPDDESERGVLVVKVDPSRTPVMLGGVIFVRQSTSTIPMLDADRRRFIAERERRYDEMMRIAGVAPADDDVVDVDAEILESAPVKAEAPMRKVAHYDPVATSRWRRNVLHNYDDDYVDPAAYLYFTADTLQYSRTDVYLDMNEEVACRLALVVSPEDAERGWLLMAFEDERVAKVPLREIFEKPENENLRYFDGAPLQFATIVRPGDALMCILADSSDGLSARCTPVDRIAECRLTSTPDRILSAPAARCLGWEQVAASAIDHLSDYMVDNLSTRQIGYTLRTRVGQAKADKEIERLFKLCRPE